ncbi:MAG: hypothetical protein HS104_19865 [Polyangiaceae bacterium]|nr:hypothetical protein [Polyangiaceae bacterium]MCE7888169.1 hypothetical protein [Sorangiineae bacterium PRO1]MCL4756096.1 hypothetical protein [Myxococcales bacterium]
MTEHTNMNPTPTHARYARAVAASKRARWDIEDVFRGRSLGADQKFLPDGLSKADRVAFLTASERRWMSRVQGRTYANVFGLVERFINAKILELSARHHFGDQTALEALVRFSEEELKHQELFRRVDVMCAAVMPEGYRLVADPNEVAHVVLGKSTWSVLALTCLIELFTQTHYTESIAPDPELNPLFKDIFRYHWMEESQHAVVDELEWRAADARTSPERREQAVSDLIDLVGAVDGILQAQAAADAAYFVAHLDRKLGEAQTAEVEQVFLGAYRYQYILSGVERTRFPAILSELISDADMSRVVAALAPLA